MSLGIAIAEWNVWRFKGNAPIEDALLRLEAAWACAIDPKYAKDLRFELTDSVHESAIGFRPLEIALKRSASPSRGSRRETFLAEPVVRQATIARHVIPKKDAFSDWLSASVKRLVETYPRNAVYDEETGIYDASHEAPVPREFFEDGFGLSDDAVKAALRVFLASLDPAANPYLRTADELLSLGFNGIPYSL